MRGKRLGLVAYVSLVAFLVANTHAGTSFAAHSELGHAHEVDAGKHSARREVKTERPGCCHGAGADGDRDEHPCGPSCPDCPKCPCPGCALCNVAKVPHVVPVACPPAAAPCLEASLPEPHVFYTPPPTGRLIRPPRS